LKSTPPARWTAPCPVSPCTRVDKVDGLNSQPWLASNNMGRMADVIAADLVRLAPEAKTAIEANLADSNSACSSSALTARRDWRLLTI
jgi:hypothetical protein